MDYFSKKLRNLRPIKTKSPKYQRNRVLKSSPAKANANASSSPLSRATASPRFIDKIILARPIVVNYQDDECATDFDESDFITDCLIWHNNLREIHGVPPLTLSHQLCSMAQFWSNHLVHTNTFYHRNSKDIGENLFCKWSSVPEFDITGQQVAKYWYSEMKLYNFYQEPSLLHVHACQFTQMVWRSSTEFGVGKARSRCGKIVIVANYKPAGNVIGEFHDNVFPPLKETENDEPPDDDDDDDFGE